MSLLRILEEGSVVDVYRNSVILYIQQLEIFNKLVT